MALLKPLFIVAGVGNSTGTGAAAARLFAKNGYSVALISRTRSGGGLDALAEEISKAGGTAKAFSVPSYRPASITSAFESIGSYYPPSQYALRAALFNVGHAVWKSFLEITEDEVVETLDTNVVAAFSFSKNVITRLLSTPPDDKVGRGALIFTGATASLRGNRTTSAFAAAKHGTRALSQSLAKEFGPRDEIHVSHAIVDGLIKTGSAIERNGERMVGLNPDSIAQAYLNLAEQEKTAWTWELDLRPASEQW
ncbi:NAD-P-binding protein [Guyanagaster necrorhizus]|uniref:NAD-P-binding protein n=1 Tax=Guyanagaster necrorhizus TaxID=856835 RepID=A0A9P7VJQ2_9AGAR|nr:NAD-P-binding protein [Guyanagaster necrorhizus MCA 3950]KAG7441747.1 NAD-P-binding protein [Guyanagaster necrorhizus MCA 3950]